MITNKAEMYRLLAQGAFGNTIEQYFSIDDWLASSPSGLWGVRTLRPGGPCHMYVETDRVAPLVSELTRAGHAINISQMVDAVRRVTLWADVQDTSEGLVVYGIEYPPPRSSWRALMPTHGQHWHGIIAACLLRKHLTPSSVADLDVLRDQYPGHVIELSACDRPIGRIPGRNAVIWEVRHY